MLYVEARRNYINQILAFQGRNSLTNEKTAERLGISQRQYERFISGASIQRELDLMLRVCELSGKTIHELTGIQRSQAEENNQFYSMLDEEHRHYADIMLRTLYNDQMRR